MAITWLTYLLKWNTSRSYPGAMVSPKHKRRQQNKVSQSEGKLDVSPWHIIPTPLSLPYSLWMRLWEWESGGLGEGGRGCLRINKIELFKIDVCHKHAWQGIVMRASIACFCGRWNDMTFTSRKFNEIEVERGGGVGGGDKIFLSQNIDKKNYREKLRKWLSEIKQCQVIGDLVGMLILEIFRKFLR